MFYIDTRIIVLRGYICCSLMGLLQDFKFFFCCDFSISHLKDENRDTFNKLPPLTSGLIKDVEVPYYPNPSSLPNRSN